MTLLQIRHSCKALIFPSALDQANPGAVEELKKQGIDAQKMSEAIGSMLPYIISKSYNVAATERVREAQLADILDTLMEKI